MVFTNGCCSDYLESMRRDGKRMKFEEFIICCECYGKILACEDIRCEFLHGTKEHNKNESYSIDCTLADGSTLRAVMQDFDTEAKLMVVNYKIDRKVIEYHANLIELFTSIGCHAEYCGGFVNHPNLCGWHAGKECDCGGGCDEWEEDK